MRIVGRAKPRQIRLEPVGLGDRLFERENSRLIVACQIALADRCAHQRLEIAIVRPRHEKIQAEDAPAVDVGRGPIEKDEGAFAHCEGNPGAVSSIRPLGIDRNAPMSARTGSASINTCSPRMAFSAAEDVSRIRETVPNKPSAAG